MVGRRRQLTAWLHCDERRCAHDRPRTVRTDRRYQEEVIAMLLPRVEEEEEAMGPDRMDLPRAEEYPTARLLLQQYCDTCTIAMAAWESSACLHRCCCFLLLLLRHLLKLVRVNQGKARTPFAVGYPPAGRCRQPYRHTRGVPAGLECSRRRHLRRRQGRRYLPRRPPSRSSAAPASHAARRMSCDGGDQQASTLERAAAGRAVAAAVVAAH